MRVMRISRYQTSDGEEFTSKEAAEEHELKLNMINQLPKLGVSEVGDVDHGNLVDWMVDNGEALIQLLSTKPKMEV